MVKWLSTLCRAFRRNRPRHVHPGELVVHVLKESEYPGACKLKPETTSPGDLFEFFRKEQKP